jgi:hypothetical protein
MKKLFFMLVLIAGFGLSMQAQASFFSADEALSNLKESLETLRTAPSMTAMSVSTSDVQAVADAMSIESKSVGMRRTIELIADYGNNAATVDLAFQDPFFQGQMVTPVMVSEAREHVLNLVRVLK